MAHEPNKKGGATAFYTQFHRGSRVVRKEHRKQPCKKPSIYCICLTQYSCSDNNSLSFQEEPHPCHHQLPDAFKLGMPGNELGCSVHEWYPFPSPDSVLSKFMPADLASLLCKKRREEEMGQSVSHCWASLNMRH